MRKRKRFRSLCLVTAVALAAGGCIHTKSEELAAVDVRPEAEGLACLRLDGLQIDSLVYTQARLPLGDFFDRMFAGEFSEAFRRVNLRYVPARSDNEAIGKLLDQGFVPVYVRIRDEHSTPSWEFEDLELRDGDRVFAPIAPGDLPGELRTLNLAAVGANVGNTILAVAAVAAIVAMAASGSSTLPLGGFGRNDEMADEDAADEPFYNDTTKVTKIDYRDYLLGPSSKGDARDQRGLVFFKVPMDARQDQLRLLVSRP